MPMPDSPLVEVLLTYLGQFLCLASAVYIGMKGNKLAAVLLFVGFIMQFQSAYVLALADLDHNSQGECWAVKESYYDCLPLLYRVTIHLSQLGVVVIALGVFAVVKSGKENA